VVGLWDFQELTRLSYGCFPSRQPQTEQRSRPQGRLLPVAVTTGAPSLCLLTPSIPQATVPAAPERSSPGPDQGSRLTPTHGSPWTRAPYSPLRDGRRAQLLGPKEWSGRDSRRVPGQAGQGESGLAGQEPGSRPAPPPGRLAPPCCGLSQVDPTVAGRRGILIQLSPRWTQGQTEG
jgi:hypothetical protein